MSIFGKIRAAVFGKAQAKPAPAPAVDTTQAPGSPPPSPAALDPEAAPLIDIENHMDSMPGADRLNWRTSIVDLMKLLGIDSDYESRKALAQEMGRSDYSGSAEDDVWLHRQVMGELTRNGGRAPPEFLD